jgi:acetyl esterase/lipase
MRISQFRTPVLFTFLLGGCGTAVTREFHYSVQKKIVYKNVDQQALTGDLYTPDYVGKKPAIIVVHGGGWDSRAGQMTEIAASLAEVGFVVFNITYRLAPEALYPKAVEDVLDAVRFIQAHADDYEVDTKRLGGWGYSAGSQLILMVGLDSANGLKAIVAGGTPADFTAWPDSPIIHKYIGKTLAEAPDVWREASPVNHVKKESPPVFLYHGEWDKIVEPEQMAYMEKALKDKGVEVKTHTVSWTGHIAVYLFSKKSIRLGAEFLRAHLHK